MEENLDLEKFKNEDYLSKEITLLIFDLTPHTKPMWGIMTPQHMLEHLEGSLKISNGEIKLTELRIKEEELESRRAFLFSNAPFAKGIVIGESCKLSPLKYSSFDEAKANFFKQLINFFGHHDQKKTAEYLHPAFGKLDYKGWLRFHYKHVKHHFEQFGLKSQG